MSKPRQKPSEHTVERFGHWIYLVSSASRRKMYHLVDLMPEEGDPMCLCEDSQFRKSLPCRHVAAAIEFVKSELDKIISDSQKPILTLSEDVKSQPQKKRVYKLKR